MTRYRKFDRPTFKRSEDVHPIWRGIGCILMIIVPLMSYLIALELVRYGLSHGWAFPPDFLGVIQFPGWVWKTPILSTLAYFIASFTNLPAILIITLVLVLIFTGIFTTLYSLLWKVVGPSRYTSVDAPPGDYRSKY